MWISVAVDPKFGPLFGVQCEENESDTHIQSLINSYCCLMEISREHIYLSHFWVEDNSTELWCVFSDSGCIEAYIGGSSNKSGETALVEFVEDFADNNPFTIGGSISSQHFAKIHYTVNGVDFISSARKIPLILKST